ncbi:MAG: hypothetical protein EX269_10320 [Acidimicrobiales bacterium]|nr:MAG: hypothetical protein EX269_10320 [Acidimicrobiales bacterium]
MAITQNETLARDVASNARWTGVGSSEACDSFEAGAEAATHACAKSDPKLFVVFAGHRHDHAAILDGVCSVAPDGSEIIGCTTGGEIGIGGPTDGGVVVMAIGGDGISVSTRFAEAHGDLRKAGETVGMAVDDIEDRGHSVLLLLSDGLAGDQQEVVRGAYATVGAQVPLVGGCAGDGLEMTSTVLFCANGEGKSIGGDSVIGAAISSVAPLGVGVYHGWQQVGDPVLITHSEGNVVHTIDEEPALDRYLRLHGAAADLADDPDAFTHFAATHPLGIVRRGGDEVRFITTADPVARTITSIASVPIGAMAWAMTGTSDSVLDATDIACSAAIEQLDGPAIGVLAFDCVARRGVMGESGIQDEVERIKKQVGAPMVGFYTYGEFARLKGASGFHNQTLVTLAIG